MRNLLLGDLNCNFLESACKRQLKQVFSIHGLKQIIQNATRITKSSASLIDIVLSSNPERIIKSKIISAHLSDHDMVGITRKINASKFKARIITTRCFARYDRSAYRNDVKNSLWDNVYEQSDVNHAWYQMYNILLKAINRHAPLIQKKVRGRECSWLTNSLRKAMRERDSLLKDARRSKFASDWAAYKRKRNQINNLLRKEINSFNRKLLYDNRNNPKQFWKTIKRVYPNKPSTVNSSCAFNLNDDCMTTSKSKISNAFGLFFSSIAQKLKESLNNLGNSIRQKLVQEILPCNRIPDPVFRFKEVCPSQVLKALNKLKSTKATGLDDVPPSMIKDASQYIAAPLAYIINLSLSSGMYPAQWKNAKIIPVYKSGSVSELDNYRPISILPAISKIAERLVHDQLAKFLEDSNLSLPTQFGFRSRYSTGLAVSYFTDTIRKEMDRGKLTGAVFIDFCKAFDTVDHAA